MTRQYPELSQQQLDSGVPINLSRRGFLLSGIGVAAGALVLGVGLPTATRAQTTAEPLPPGTRVPAFLQIRPDGTAILQSPFNEGGQGTFTGMAQLVGEELDLEPEKFTVVNAPTGPDYLVVGGKMRITGGSMSIRMSYDTMRRLGALARAMLIEAAATELAVPAAELSTEPGRVIHAASGRSLGYGQIASAALDLPVPAPESVTQRDPASFRWIGKSQPRLDAYDKSTGRAVYTIDIEVDGMLYASVQHAPRLGLTVGAIGNLDAVRAMAGVHSVHDLDGAIAVVAEGFWQARTAAEALVVDWQDKGPTEGLRYMPADFSTAAYVQKLTESSDDGVAFEQHGNVADAFAAAGNKLIEARYHSQMVHHAQLEPPSTIARFNADGTLEIWAPNQAPEQFQADMAKHAGLAPEQVVVHTPILGGFFGRHFLYAHANPYPQAIRLAKETGRPIKLIWTREEEFLRDPLRPLAAVRFKGALGADGIPVAIEVVSATEGPTEGIYGHNPDKIDETAIEGLSGKSYAIPNVRIAQSYAYNPASLAYWRSVGNSMNDFLYESFLDEMADAGGKDPFELRMTLLKGNARLSHLLGQVAEMSGGWKRGPFKAEDGTRRARGVAMASPFGSHAAAIAEVSLKDGKVVVHDVWEALDPGSVVNPGQVEAQIRGAVMLGVSQVLMEEAVYENGEPVARNYDLYPILPLARAPRVHVRIVESGEPIGGVGEPPLPAVPPAVANAVSTLIGRRIRSMPIDPQHLES